MANVDINGPMSRTQQRHLKQMCCNRCRLFRTSIMVAYVPVACGSCGSRAATPSRSPNLYGRISTPVLLLYLQINSATTISSEVMCQDVCSVYVAAVH